MCEKVICSFCGREFKRLWVVQFGETDDGFCPSCVLEILEVEELTKLEAKIRDECRRRIDELENLAELIREFSISSEYIWKFLMGMLAAGEVACPEAQEIAEQLSFLEGPVLPCEAVADKVRQRAEVLRKLGTPGLAATGT